MSEPNKTSNRDNFNTIVILLTFFFPVIPVTLCLIFNFLNDNFSNVLAVGITSVLITLLICIVAFYNIVEDKNENHGNEINKLEQKHKEEINKLNQAIKNENSYHRNEINKLEQKHKEEINKLNQENENLKVSYNLKGYIKENFKNGTKYLAELYCDINTVDFDLLSNYLEFKKHPAIKKAQDIKQLKEKYSELLIKERLMRYEYEMLFNLFPELENYLEYYSEEKNNTIDEIKDNYDYVQNWISKEEYNSLSENSRNQLALERYIDSRKKSKWAIGRDYEMFIGYEYEKQGYKVTYCGITEKLNDKGRDLIAQKDNEILIIQCKNWSKYKEIHENHICQLYGTTIQFNIENNSLFKATPVFVTSSSLSDTARKFAKYLGIQIIENKKLEEFPRIKCNINGKEKIYHLPFDQQYDRTIVGDRKGEFYAWNVDEATKKGFRRAKKYFYSK